MALNLKGMWEKKQLSSQSRNIVSKYLDNLDGKAVSVGYEQEGETTDTDIDM